MRAVWAIGGCWWLLAGVLCAAEPVSFQRDVMPVLSRTGCNSGACHGNQNGKGGFKLSLRGQDPDIDYDVLTRDFSERRVNRLDPAASLLLLKPTLAVPHEGGQRFRQGSPEWTILQQWMEQGLPCDTANLPPVTALQVEPLNVVLPADQEQVSLKVRARFADGAERDVTALAVYETSTPIVEISPEGVVKRLSAGEVTVIVRYLTQQVPVRVTLLPPRAGFVWSQPPVVNYIDEHVDRKLQLLQLNPTGLSDDVSYLRRVMLDLTGTLPTAVEARRFVAETSSTKRAVLVDDLLQRAEFADWWALKWSDLLRNEEKTLDRKGVQNYHAWIRQCIASGMPLDQFVREIIASRGSTYSSPPANYYRALRDPLTRGETTAQVFLGMRLQCARCHNHPFDQWTQADYYSWAALFARVDYKILENRRRDQNDSHEFDGEQIVFMAREGEVKNPRTRETAAPAFLGAAKPVAQGDDRLARLAEWITVDQQRQLARVLVNRVWAQLMGRGLVEPVDDFRATNPATHPELLEALTDDFIAQRFDLRGLLRRIIASRTYQLATTLPGDSTGDPVNYTHVLPRRLTAEQLLDGWSQTLSAELTFQGYPAGFQARTLPGVSAVRSREFDSSSPDEFLRVFGKPPRLQACDCERNSDATLNQAFQLISGPVVNELLTREQNQLGRWIAENKPANELLDDLYWSVLSRAPTAIEVNSLLPLLERAGTAATSRREILEDITWGLLNSDEFLLRR